MPTETKLHIEIGDEESLRKVVEQEPANVETNFALAQLHYRRGETGLALERLGNIAGNFVADGLAARIELERADGDRTRVREAFASLDAGDIEAGLELLLAELEAAEDEADRERLRKAVVAVLDVLGVEHPLARDARRRLASALF